MLEVGILGFTLRYARVLSVAGIRSQHFSPVVQTTTHYTSLVCSTSVRMVAKNDSPCHRPMYLRVMFANDSNTDFTPGTNCFEEEESYHIIHVLVQHQTRSNPLRVFLYAQ